MRDINQDIRKMAIALAAGSRPGLMATSPDILGLWRAAEWQA